MRSRPLLVMLVALLSPAPAGAQHYGQWSWEGALGLGGRRFENHVEGSDTPGIYDQIDLKLSLGLNGFLLHPVIGSFHLGIDGVFSRYRGGLVSGTRDLGGSVELSLLPQGTYPVRLFASRLQYSYGESDGKDPFSIFGLPRSSTRIGGRVRARDGVLRGLALNIDRRTTDHVAKDEPADEDEVESLDWARAQKDVVHHYRLERRRHKYGAIDYETEDITGTVDEHGTLWRNWRWDLSGYGVHRSLRYADASPYGVDSVTLGNHLVRTTAKGNAVDLSYLFGLVRSDTTSQSHSLRARYEWRVSRHVNVSPTLAYTYQQSAATTAQLPEAGLGATWQERRGAFDLVLNGGVFAGTLQASGEGSASSSYLGLSGGLHLAHGTLQGLRKELQLSAFRNSARRAGESDQPDLGAGLGAVGTEDLLSARFTLSGAWGTLRASCYGELSQRDSQRLALSRYSVTTRSAMLNVDTRFAVLSLNAGTSRVEQAVSQRLAYLSGGLSFRIGSFLSARAGYRKDSRHLVIGPALDGTRVDLGADLRVGAFLLTAQAFSSTEETERLERRTNRGITWSLTRRFGGSLPIITGPQRRGVIQ